MSWFAPELAAEQNESNSITESNSVGFDISALDAGMTIHLWNGGKLHLHQVLEAVLATVGRSDVHLCSWSISVPAMKSMLRLHASGLISSIAGVVDFRTRKDHPEAFAMALSLFRSLRVHPCHAKVIVLTGGAFPVSIIGSANLTNNPKQERIAIVSDDQTVMHDLDVIVSMLEKGEQP